MMLALTLAFAVLSAAQIVTLSGGTLEGAQCESSDALYFYSIPFVSVPSISSMFATAILELDLLTLFRLNHQQET